MSGEFSQNTQFWGKSNWIGDGGTYFYHVLYSVSYDIISFVEDPVSDEGIRRTWSKDYETNSYTKLTSTVDEEVIEEISVTKEEAEKEAWRILNYFHY